MTPHWPQAAVYLQLALSIDRHLPGFVDAYFGPAEPWRAAREMGKLPLEELAAVTASVLENVSADQSLSPTRRGHLEAQLRAMQAVVEILRGESLPILEEARRLYGLTPAWTDESIFLDAHRALEEILPGDGSLAERCLAFERRMEVPQGDVHPMIREVARDLQSRAVARFSLPPGEKCEFRLVRGKPWYAYNHYRGSFTSCIELNVDVPVNILYLPLTLAHEAYPGHHTESAIKEQRLVRDLGGLEHTVQIKNSPSSVVSEGIANNALRVLADREQRLEIYASLLRRCGRSEAESERAEAYLEAQGPLRRVRPNCILLAYQQHASDAELLTYSKRFGLLPENEAQMSLRYIKDPLRRSYGFTYPWGEELVRRFVFGGADPIARFAHLLETPTTPGQVLQGTQAPSPPGWAGV